MALHSAYEKERELIISKIGQEKYEENLKALA